MEPRASTSIREYDDFDPAESQIDYPKWWKNQNLLLPTKADKLAENYFWPCFEVAKKNILRVQWLIDHVKLLENIIRIVGGYVEAKSELDSMDPSDEKYEFQKERVDALYLRVKEGFNIL